jgi:hypothetical protein
MEHDIFFSISQTPDGHGHIPSESVMLNNYFEQLACADQLGFGRGMDCSSPPLDGNSKVEFKTSGASLAG